jgi:uncharacterized protein (DUF433 family)
MSLAELEEKIAGLSHAEKIQLLQRLEEELGLEHTGIEKTPGVAGGDARIAGTRIEVWVLENFRRLGWSEAFILENYPSLRAADLANAWAYVAANREEIDRAIPAVTMSSPR